MPTEAALLEDEESGAPDGEDEETEVTRHAGLEDALEGLAEKITAGLFPQENITPENPRLRTGRRRNRSHQTRSSVDRA